MNMHSMRDRSFITKGADDARIFSVVRRSVSITALWMSSVCRAERSSSGSLCLIFRREVQFSCSSGRERIEGIFGSIASRLVRDLTKCDFPSPIFPVIKMRSRVLVEFCPQVCR